MSLIKCLHLENSAVSVVLFLAILGCSLAGLLDRKFFMKLFFHPYSVVNDGQYYRLLSSDLVHVNWVHLLVNLLMLYAGCVGLEGFLSEKSAIGHLIFSGIYLVSHFVGIILITIRHYRDFGFSSAGASGSIMGCLFCYMVIQPDVVAFYVPVVGPVNNIFAGLIFIVMLIRLQFKDQQVFNHELHFYSGAAGLVLGVLLKNWL
ncbi:rhomboid family intramembrane serine protease [Mucilaginibacter sp. SJ]|uniref:rhomboid family intramembrane serine protease n=1 Tax=Mucilaginibacter sp. SJ TaxID=3029053 RepID=UPI0023A971BB|nr:rhomboid family intramembrane serine protease [Mucilaginibacter sp. SJ]WEA01780.1 rhomboid family intramembrane serine protease [Mucilaginibacter sp. SJ]